MPKPKLKTSDAVSRTNYVYTESVYSISSSNASNSSSGPYSNAASLKIDYDEQDNATISGSSELKVSGSEVGGYRMIPVVAAARELTLSGNYVENRANLDSADSLKGAQLDVPSSPGASLKGSSGTNGTDSLFR